MRGLAHRSWELVAPTTYAPSAFLRVHAKRPARHPRQADPLVVARRREHDRRPAPGVLATGLRRHRDPHEVAAFGNPRHRLPGLHAPPGPHFDLTMEVLGRDPGEQFGQVRPSARHDLEEQPVLDETHLHGRPVAQPDLVSEALRDPYGKTVAPSLHLGSQVVTPKGASALMIRDGRAGSPAMPRAEGLTLPRREAAH